MRLLIVEDDAPLREAIRDSALNWVISVGDRAAREARFDEVVEARSVAEGLSCLKSAFDLMIVDVRLGDESGARVVEHALRQERAPIILAISGQATATEAFTLAALGVRAYLGKPFDMRQLRTAIVSAFERPPDLALSAMAQVGHRHVHVVQDEVKSAMVRQALTLESGNITRAAKRLGVTRAAVQQMIDRYGLPRPQQLKTGGEKA